MVIVTPFELNSIKDQLSLLTALTSHINFDGYAEKELEPDFKQLLQKMDTMAKNLTAKFNELKTLLDT